jgi:hypothetical protein
LTVQIFTDPVKMMQGGGDLYTAAKIAFNMSDEDFMKKFEQSAKSRDLAQDFGTN